MRQTSKKEREALVSQYTPRIAKIQNIFQSQKYYIKNNYKVMKKELVLTGKYYSSVKIQRPSTTLWGKLAQHIGILFGVVLKQNSPESFLCAARKAFPSFFDSLGKVPSYTNIPLQERTISINYHQPTDTTLSGSLSVSFRKWKVAQVVWHLELYSDGAVLKVFHSPALLKREQQKKFHDLFY